MAYRMPNGYGSVVKLGGRRRKPYAVRITIGYKLTGTEDAPRVVQQYRYLEYFEKRADAVKYLAEYNSGLRVKEHRSISDVPTFAQVFERVMQDRQQSRRGMKDALRRSYSAAFRKFEAIHDMKVCNLRFYDLQPIIDENRHMSKSTVYNMVTVCRMIAAYAVKYEYTDVDFSAHLTCDYADSEEIHHPFSKDEIRRLWERRDLEGVQLALITIYTGMRPSEALEASATEDDLCRRYLIGGIKTEAGKNRVIPLHPDIIPVLRERLLACGGGRLFRYASLQAFRARCWDPAMKDLCMEHLPHDGRHTCATLMEAAGVPVNRRKLILGHALKDVTEGVYTHVSPGELIAEIDKIAP